jgi:hypothetical protein
MSQGSLTSFTTDRFANFNSALVLNGGWTQVPPGIYFDTPEFSITVWVFPQQIGFWSRVIDFGNVQADNIILSLDSGNGLSQNPVFTVGIGPWLQLGSPQKLTLNQWQHLAATYNGSLMSIYINGTLMASLSFTTRIPQSISRSNCYVGKSNFVQDGYSNSILDDLRFYNKSLSKCELDLLIKNLSE